MDVELLYKGAPDVKIVITWEQAQSLYAAIDGEAYPDLMQLKSELAAILHG